MQANKLYQFTSQEKLVRAFADEVVEDFLKNSELKQALAVRRFLASNPNGEYLDKAHSRENAKVVWQNTYELLATIMTCDSDKKYAKKRLGFIPSKKLISITWCSGFYDHLLVGVPGIEEDDESLRDMVPMNTEYIIDRTNLTIMMKTYQEFIIEE